ncbi:MAG TPA: CoA transferase, partial [Myxococcota bacterium]|nr:CoA transferase [Myxococcota bacterium]
LARAIGRPELARDERFKGAVERFKNNRELAALLEEVFLARTLEAWGEALASERLIWAPVRTLVEASRTRMRRRAGCSRRSSIPTTASSGRWRRPCGCRLTR